MKVQMRRGGPDWRWNWVLTADCESGCPLPAPLEPALLSSRPSEGYARGRIEVVVAERAVDEAQAWAYAAPLLVVLQEFDKALRAVLRDINPVGDERDRAAELFQRFYRPETSESAPVPAKRTRTPKAEVTSEGPNSRPRTYRTGLLSQVRKGGAK